MTVPERPDATTPGTRPNDDHNVRLATGLLLTCIVGTNAGFNTAYDMTALASRVTAGHAPLGSPPGTTTAHEVATIRDVLVRRGLTRQHIARALGVDRRSLSGWASGDIRPTPERLVALRALVRAVTAIDTAHPGRAREILTRQRSGTDLLGQLANGRADILLNWEEWTTRSRDQVTVTRRRGPAEPVWAAAVAAKATGRLDQLEPRPTVRDEAEDEMDLDEAASFVEPPTNPPRRRGFR